MSQNIKKQVPIVFQKMIKHVETNYTDEHWQ